MNKAKTTEEIADKLNDRFDFGSYITCEIADALAAYGNEKLEQAAAITENYRSGKRQQNVPELENWFRGLAEKIRSKKCEGK